jgi:hypothetical protein
LFRFNDRFVNKCNKIGFWLFMLSKMSKQDDSNLKPNKSSFFLIKNNGRRLFSFFGCRDFGYLIYGYFIEILCTKKKLTHTYTNPKPGPQLVLKQDTRNHKLDTRNHFFPFFSRQINHLPIFPYL